MIGKSGSARTALAIRALPFLLALLATASYGSPPADPPEANRPVALYIEELLAEARRAELHEDPYWRTLLHYKKGVYGLRSLVDDPRFFLAEKGKHDPKAELEATIRAFFRPAEEGEKHPVCRFAARYDWLKRKLAIDEARLPVPGCAPIEELLDRIGPERITLVFPTSHMNSPASMYGHTLLAVRTAYESDLLSYAINYSALTRETFGPFYIVRGLLGLYPGYFSILPYYAKLQEYSDVNDRDIWEYELDLNAEEIRRLLLHVYELENIYSDYYFFNENCSYDLLFLLDAARPGLSLTDQCAWWVIPLDTIREIKKSGLVRGVAYRPSRSTKIEHLASLLGGEERKVSLAAADGEIEPPEILARASSENEKALMLDLAGEVLQYRHAKKELAQEAYVDRFMQTLNARSSLGEAGEAERPAIRTPARPDEGHHSSRASAGYGADEDGPIVEIRLRPAYHQLLDNDGGYKPGSQIVFGDLALRSRPEDGEIEIESVDLIDIVSIAPRSDIFRHTSWKIRTDLFRRPVADGRDYLVYRLNPGFGLAYRIDPLGLVYAMIETDLQAGGALEGGYSAGAGASAGILRNLTRRWKAHLSARDVYLPLGDRDNQFEAGLGQNVELFPDISLAAEVLAAGNDRDRGWEAVVRWNVFF